MSGYFYFVNRFRCYFQLYSAGLLRAYLQQEIKSCMSLNNGLVSKKLCKPTKWIIIGPLIHFIKYNVVNQSISVVNHLGYQSLINQHDDWLARVGRQ